MSALEGGREGGAVGGIGGALSCWAKSHAGAGYVNSQPEFA